MQEEIRSALIKYLDVYFVERNLTATLELFYPEVMGFGTGVDEIAYTLQDFERLYQRDLSEAPSPIYYQIQRLDVRSPQPGVGHAACELDIRTHILEQQVTFYKLRLSLLYLLVDGRWLITHMHISFPTQAHQADESYPIKELEERNLVLQKLVDQKTKHLSDAIHEISILASTDKLTGLYNRLKIDACLDTELQRSLRYSNALSVILIDIDHFKKVNDLHGHLAGDQILIQVAKLIANRLRKTDLIGRWGGEEFLVICPETSLESAAFLADDVRFMIESTHFEGVGSITISLGVSAYKHGDTHDSLLFRVDTALYEAKHRGRNNVFTRQG